ncbi:ankyrin repeat domain-containing protein [Pseudomonas sp.]|uniref:ankyrin repeat domain-containing protein n=1 Tax=Pseudomonas sp. TaxID=306 RepID=UPI0028A7021E|nr:ankyrin repeat domain-containing protein [Pseudomonas sp.]
MRKLVICAIALAMAGCNSEYDIREVNTNTDEKDRVVHTVKGERISGSIVTKDSKGEITSKAEVKDGFLHGASFKNIDGKPFIKSSFNNGFLTGTYEKFCDDGSHEVKRQIVSWPDSYSEETYSCNTGFQLTKTQKANAKKVGEQIVWADFDGKQVLQSKLNFNNEGQHDGKNLWFDRDGKLLKSADYKNGVLDGEYVEYEENTGNIEGKGIYKDGNKFGLWENRFGKALVGEGVVNPDEVKNQVYLALGINPINVTENLTSWATQKNPSDLSRAQFYIDKGMVDFAKPFSINTALDSLRNSRENQTLYRFMPVTNMVDEELVDWVVERGADVNATDYEGKNRLMRCLEGSLCSTEHMAKLIKVSDTNLTDINGRNVLHTACQPASTPNKEVHGQHRKLMMDIGEVNQQDKFGWTPLHYCLSSGYIEEAKALIARGADIAIKSKDGVSASEMVWLMTRPEPGSDFQLNWNKAREGFATELQKAGKLSFHTKLPAFEKSIRDLAMSNGNIELVQRIDAIEPM